MNTFAQLYPDSSSAPNQNDASPNPASTQDAQDTDTMESTGDDALDPTLPDTGAAPLDFTSLIVWIPLVAATIWVAYRVYAKRRA